MKRVKKKDGTIHMISEEFLKEILKEGDVILDDPSITPPAITAEDLENDLKRHKAEEGKRYLAKTDWYVSRKAETGKAIPDDILTKRQQARIDADFKI
tara:strand:+ start:236 stop:529 length:294 start_codon:yes stop_codon:yes gene_type:complete